MVELFFDLVFVFAVTQLSHALLADLTVTGAAHITLLLPAVWWVWVYTSWTTNWFNPERMPVRLCLFAMMIAGLVLAAAIPGAFDQRAVFFGCAYVSMQIGRTAFVLWAVRGAGGGFSRPSSESSFGLELRRCSGSSVHSHRRNTFRLVGGRPRARAAAPPFYFWVPGLGRSAIADWDIDGAHMAERCALFVIIAFGESLLITGATFAELQWNRDTILWMLIAVVGTIAMWWVYFDTGAERAQHRIVHASDPVVRRVLRTPTFIFPSLLASLSAPWPMSSCWRIPSMRRMRGSSSSSVVLRSTSSAICSSSG